MKGDRVEIVVDIGNAVQQFEVLATKAGRRVEISSGRGTIEVTEVTRSGRAVRSARFMTSRVVAIVEHPSDDDETVSSGRRRAGAPGSRAGRADAPTVPRLL